jgi:Ca2+-binding RTX toxin-like protein
MTVRTSGRIGYGGRDLDSMLFEPWKYSSNGAGDRVVAGNGPNELYGNGGNDTLVGGAGDDELFGGAGKDTLLGGKGADYFVFTHAPSATNVDRVMDFSRTQHDKILLSYKYFKAVNLVLKYDATGHVEEDRRMDLPVGHLSRNEFRLGKAALLETDRILYDKATGALTYDKDGSGAAAAVKIANFKAGTTLAWSDILFY